MERLVLGVFLNFVYPYEQKEAKQPIYHKNVEDLIRIFLFPLILLAQIHRKTDLGNYVLIFICINLMIKTLASQQRTDTLCPSQQAMTHFLPKPFCHWIQEPFSAVVKNSSKP